MNENEIVDMYRNENKSTYEIAKKFDTYPNKIRRILIKNGCEMKDKSAAQKNALKKGVAAHPTKGKKRSEKPSSRLVNHKQRYGIIYLMKKDYKDL